MKKYLTELLGTFCLALAVGLSLGGAFPIPTPVIAALTLGLFVYTVGHVSGAHLNPAITLGALSIRKIALEDAVGYWVAQFIGGGLALFVTSYFTQPGLMNLSLDPRVAVAEGLGAFFFAFGVAAVIYGRVPKDINGIAVGGSLLLGISVAASVSNGVLNPAVAVGIGSFSPAYLFGPLVGALLGMWVYKWLSGEKK